MHDCPRGPAVTPPRKAGEVLAVNDNQRTVAYVVVAALAVLVAAEPWSRRHALAHPPRGNGPPISGFQRSAGRCQHDDRQVRRSDRRTASVSGGPGRRRLVDPSHQNYPADAKEQLAKAATALMDLKILGVATNKPGEHELYGVLDPDPKTVGPGSIGIGNRVTMKDGKDNVLADLIIGKADKDQPQWRYVRKAGRDQVYKTVIQTDMLSTKFGDWIEKDLLKLNPLDILSVQLNDYSSDASLTAQGQLKVGRDRRSEITLDYDDAKNAWKLKDLVEYVNGKPVPEELKEDEELNTEKLTALKTALDDLQIVNVERKPAGMKELRISADVPRDQLLTQLQSLAQRGFYPVGNRDGSIDLLSSEGEAIVDLKDGTQYILRFGQIASSDEEGKESAAKKEPGSRLNRYLFVMAQFDPDLIPKPTLEPLPGDDADQPADEAKAEADEKKTDEKKTDGKEKPDDKEKPAAEAKPDDPAKNIDQQAKEEDEAEKKKAEDEKRAAIERENKRKQDEYEEKLKKGEEHVKQLNERFADWYYVISDDVYHKIHLAKADVVKTKEAKPGEGDTPADLQELQKKGLGKGPTQ